MKDFIEFLKTYYREIIEISVLLLSVIICLIRKRPCINKMDEIKEDVLEILPILIRGVESPGNGSSKKSLVIESVKSFVKKKFKIECPEQVITLVDSQIESVLSTPQKKGN